MTEPTIAAKSDLKPRATGAVYLLYFITAILGVFCAKRLVVPGDAAATARNILTHESSFRFAFALSLIGNVFYIALTVLFYRMFRPVHATLSLLAAFFSLVGCTIQIMGSFFQLAPLVLLDSSVTYLPAFSARQLEALAFLCFRLQAQTFNISLVFFALFCLFIGYLIYRSTFLPRVLGVLLILAGFGWLTYLWPPFAATIARYTQPFGFLAELALMLWLLVKGIDVQRWIEIVGTSKA
jgi:hypothetical protein